MFGTIRKHQSWLWIVIITLTIISFVYFFSPQQQMQDGYGKQNYGSINGKDISREAYAKAARETYLRYFFMSGGNWPDAGAQQQGFDETREAYQWLLLIQKQEQHGIHVSPGVVADVARQMLEPFKRANINSVEGFRKQVLEPRGFTLEDFERFVRHYVGLQELMSVAGLSGKLVTPDEIKALYIRENQQIAASAVVFDSSNYLAKVNVTPEAIAQFYSNRLASYRIPERVQVNYVRFGLTNFYADADKELAAITNLSQRVDAIHAQNTNLFADAKSPEEAKTRIREQMRREVAQLNARRKANEFATEVFDKEPVSQDNLQLLAKQHGYEVQVTPPFDRSEPPPTLNVGQQFATAAFRLSPTNEPFGGPIIGEDAVYVIAFNKRIPSEIPTLEAVREKVRNDYMQMEAARLARQDGAAFAQAVTNTVAQGKNFADAANAAKVKLIDIPPFSLSTRSLPGLDETVNINQLKQLAFSTPVGKVSPFVPTADGGIVMFVKERLPIDEAKMNEQLPAFSQYVRQSRQSEAFNDWFRREAERGLRDTPLARPQTPPDLQQQGGAAPAKTS